MRPANEHNVTEERERNMICEIVWGVDGKSRARRRNRVFVAGVACLGLSLSGSGGFLAAQEQEQPQKSTPVHYKVQDLGVVGANLNQPGQPLQITNGGWVAGAAGVGAAEHAVLWRGNQMLDIGDPGLGGNSIANSVNDWVQVVGEAENTSSHRPTTEDFCGFQALGFSSSPTPCVPFILKNGRMVPLKTLGGVNGVASYVNGWGGIVGYTETTIADPGCPAPQQYQFKPAVWFGDLIGELPTGSDPEGVAFSLNDLGQAVGASGSCGPFNPVWLFNLVPAHALLWVNGKPTDLGNLGGVMNNLAYKISNRGEVIGGSDLAGDQTSHAFLWTAATKMQDLGTVNDAVDQDTYSVGLGINDQGEIVGVSANADFSIARAFIRQNGKLVDLNSLVAGTSSLYLFTACSINTQGEIIGIGLDTNTGETHAYLASPTKEAAVQQTSSKPMVLPDSVRAQLRYIRTFRPAGLR
jgi:probable HAF family extracellular repeat protein